MQNSLEHYGLYSWLWSGLSGPRRASKNFSSLIAFSVSAVTLSSLWAYALLWRKELCGHATGELFSRSMWSVSQSSNSESLTFNLAMLSLASARNGAESNRSVWKEAKCQGRNRQEEGKATLFLCQSYFSSGIFFSYVSLIPLPFLPLLSLFLASLSSNTQCQKTLVLFYICINL